MIRDLCFDRSGDVHGFGNGRAVVGMHGGSNRKKENTFNGGDASRNFRFDGRSYAPFLAPSSPPVYSAELGNSRFIVSLIMQLLKTTDKRRLDWEMR
jgi:hypothetical protein